MQIVTPKQMAKIEERSEKLGVSKKQLMENAGKTLADLIDNYCRREIKRTEGCSVVFLTGKGNNGGDCLAAANILVYRGYSITIIDIGGQPETALSKEMMLRLPKERISFIDGYRNKALDAAIESAELEYMTTGGDTSLEALENKKDRNP